MDFPNGNGLGKGGGDYKQILPWEKDKEGVEKITSQFSSGKRREEVEEIKMQAKSPLGKVLRREEDIKSRFSSRGD